MSKVLTDEIGTVSGTDVSITTGNKVSGTASQYKMTDLVAGDVVYASSDDTLGRLAKGAASEVLTMNAGATAPEWASAPSGNLKQVVSNTITPIDVTGSGTDWAVSATQPTTSDGTLVGTIAITPASTSNLVFLNWACISDTDTAAKNHYYLIFRGTTFIFASEQLMTYNQPHFSCWSYIDSPSSTSEVTYTVRADMSSVNHFFINRCEDATNASGTAWNNGKFIAMEMVP
tara:strand:+ start:3568 stop:4260 length:693 start_codon:yes stop_codon:yes gene_type:complete